MRAYALLGLRWVCQACDDSNIRRNMSLQRLKPSQAGCVARSCRAQPRNGCARVRARAHEPNPFIYQQERAMAAPQAQVAGQTPLT